MLASLGQALASQGEYLALPQNEAIQPVAECRRISPQVTKLMILSMATPTTTSIKTTPSNQEGLRLPWW